MCSRPLAIEPGVCQKESGVCRLEPPGCILRLQVCGPMEGDGKYKTTGREEEDGLGYAEHPGSPESGRIRPKGPLPLTPLPGGSQDSQDSGSF